MIDHLCSVIMFNSEFQAGKYGQLTYVRVYQGVLKRSSFIFNTRTGKRVRVPRIVRMHSDVMEVNVNFNQIFPKIYFLF